METATTGVYDRVEYEYNRQRQPMKLKDQNGSVHEYVYDGRGRQTVDKVTAVGAGVDDADSGGSSQRTRCGAWSST